MTTASKTEIHSKGKLRSRFRSLRQSFKDSLSHQFGENSFLVFEKNFQASSLDTLFLYAPLPGELQTRLFFEWAGQNKLSICFPKVTGPHEMKFYPISRWDELQNSKGIHEPPVSTEKTPTARSLILTPGLAFDREGHRLGYGKGFYDRYFSKHREGFRLGHSLDQTLLFAPLPRSSHDQKVDAILCPSGLWKAPA